MNNNEKIINDLRLDRENLLLLISKLQSNWNSLRGYIKAHIEILDTKLALIGTCNPDKATKELQIYQNVLDKMNELESGEKN